MVFLPAGAWFSIIILELLPMLEHELLRKQVCRARCPVEARALYLIIFMRAQTSIPSLMTSPEAKPSPEVSIEKVAAQPIQPLPDHPFNS